MFLAVFFGCILFGTLLSLPLIYDYFFYEEEIEEYEELGYVELVLDYVVSSFQEAFVGILDLISKMFFQSVRYMIFKEKERYIVKLSLHYFSLSYIIYD